MAEEWRVRLSGYYLDLLHSYPLAFACRGLLIQYRLQCQLYETGFCFVKRFGLVAGAISLFFSRLVLALSTSPFPGRLVIIRNSYSVVKRI
jgi:hypothetical protein